MDEYRLVFLKPGQRMPAGGTGVILETDGIVWIGESGTFPTKVEHGDFLPNDTLIETTYDSRAMTQEEIDEYNSYLSDPGGAP